MPNAHSEGYAAFATGRSIYSNPYRFGTQYYFAWRSGWIDAANESEEDSTDDEIGLGLLK